MFLVNTLFKQSVIHLNSLIFWKIGFLKKNQYVTEISYIPKYTTLFVREGESPVGWMVQIFINDTLLLHLK